MRPHRPEHPTHAVPKITGLAPLPADRDGLPLDPLRTWLQSFARAISAWRLYPPTSAMREQQVGLAVRGLAGLLDQRGALSFGIREGQVLVEEQVVFLDDDVEHGPTHLLAASSIFELAFQVGVDAEQLATLISILAEDPAQRRRVGEELVTLIWRRNLRHVRYHHVDVLSAAVVRERGAARRLDLESSETDRLREALASIVQALAVDEATGADVVLMADRALETPEHCRRAISAGESRLESVRLLFERGRPRGELGAVQLAFARESTADALTARLADLLLEAIRFEARPLEPSPALTSFLRLYRGMMDAGAYAAATTVVERVQRLAADPTRVHDPELARSLLLRLAERERVEAALRDLDAAEDPRQSQRIGAYLAALGEDALPTLLAQVEALERPGAREAAAEVLVALTERRLAELLGLVERARPEVAGPLLRAVQRQPAAVPPMIASALRSKHAAVRAQSARMLLGFALGAPDDALARLIDDDDPRPRAVALRGLAARRSGAGAQRLAQLLAHPAVLERAPEELSLLLAAAAAVVGVAAVAPLERLLGVATRLTAPLESNAAGAVAGALAGMEATAAREVLERAARSLNPRLRSAARSALAKGGRAERARLGPGEGTGDLGPRPEWPGQVRLDGRGPVLGVLPASAPSSSLRGTPAREVWSTPPPRRGLATLSTAAALQAPGGPRLDAPRAGPEARTAVSTGAAVPGVSTPERAAPTGGPALGARVEPAGGAPAGPAAAPRGHGLRPLPSASFVPAASASFVPAASASFVPAASASIVPAVSASIVPAASASFVPAASASFVPAASASSVPAGSFVLAGSASRLAGAPDPLDAVQILEPALAAETDERAPVPLPAEALIPLPDSAFVPLADEGQGALRGEWALAIHELEDPAT